MKKQLIISVGREFGSGGHVIAETLAKRFDLPLYDSNILESIAQERNVDAKTLHRYDEVHPVFQKGKGVFDLCGRKYRADAVRVSEEKSR